MIDFNMNPLDALFCDLDAARRYLVVSADARPPLDPAVVKALLSRPEVRTGIVRADRGWVFREMDLPAIEAGLKAAGVPFTCSPRTYPTYSVPWYSIHIGGSHE